MSDIKAMVLPIGRLRTLNPFIERISPSVPNSPDHGALECSGAECPKCKMTINASELLQLCRLEGDVEIRDPLLRRLYDGKCINQGCESSEYTVSFVVRQESDWIRFEEQMRFQAELALVSQVDEKRVAKRRQLLVLLGGIIGSVVLFFGIRHWIFGYRIPLIQKKRTFPLAPQNSGAAPSK
jgi:hypothetical protein